MLSPPYRRRSDNWGKAAGRWRQEPSSRELSNTNKCCPTPWLPVPLAASSSFLTFLLGRILLASCADVGTLT